MVARKTFIAGLLGTNVLRPIPRYPELLPTAESVTPSGFVTVAVTNQHKSEGSVLPVGLLTCAIVASLATPSRGNLDISAFPSVT